MMEQNRKTRILGKMLFCVVFAGVFFFAAGYKIYKVRNVGITYDESFTYLTFCDKFSDALSKYDNPNNNHVINSLLICLAGKFLKGYEHFIRIPSLISGILFIAAMGVIIYRTIENRLLKIAGFALVALNAFAFDLSFLARGYSHALAGMFCGIALIVVLFDRKIRYRNLWLPIVILSGINFISFGSMLSSLWFLGAINLVFIIFYSGKVFCDLPEKNHIRIINFAGVAILSGLSLYLLYFNLYKKILSAKGNFGMVKFGDFMNELLFLRTLNFESPTGLVVSWVLIFLIAISLVICSHKILKAKTGLKDVIFEKPGKSFIIFVTVVSIGFIFYYRQIIGESIGFARNGVFLVPLLLVSGCIIIDSGISFLEKRRLKNAALLFSFISLCLMAWQQIPSQNLVEVHNWNEQCMSRPLLKSLQKIDPERVWKIGMSKGSIRLMGCIIYYQKFGYKFEFAWAGEPWDVIIVKDKEADLAGLRLGDDNFSRYGYVVYVNEEILGEISFPKTSE